MSTLPIQIMLQTQEAMEDQVITVSESTEMMTTVFNSMIGAMVMAFGMVMFNRVIGGKK